MGKRRWEVDEGTPKCLQVMLLRARGLSISESRQKVPVIIIIL